jgi:hypothetical protein
MKAKRITKQQIAAMARYILKQELSANMANLSRSIDERDPFGVRLFAKETFRVAKSIAAIDDKTAKPKPIDPLAYEKAGL